MEQPGYGEIGHIIEDDGTWAPPPGYMSITSLYDKGFRYMKIAAMPGEPSTLCKRALRALFTAMQSGATDVTLPHDQYIELKMWPDIKQYMDYRADGSFSVQGISIHRAAATKSVPDRRTTTRP